MSHSLLLTHMKTDYRYPGIKDTSLPGDTLLLVLTLVNITVTCGTYGVATLLMCACGQEQNSELSPVTALRLKWKSQLCREGQSDWDCFKTGLMHNSAHSRARTQGDVITN